jgi:acetylornithine deacetylase
MMQQLIACPSVSSVSPHWDQSNEAVIQRLADWTKAAGFTVEVMPIEGFPGKYNLIASIGSGPDGLVLSGHTDTVPYDDGKWNSDPFKLLDDNHKWYGLGTCDMKGFFAVVLEALRDIDLKQLKKPLVILATADEESSMSGARSLLDKQRQLGRHAVIGEPTELKPIRMHKGIAMEAIRLTGRSGHSSNPALGNNALDGMYTVIGELMQWRQSLQQRYHNPMFEIDVPTVNLGHIHGGDNPNRICAHCELHFDIRPLPGMDIEALREEIDHRLSDALASTGLKLERVSLFEGIPAMETDANAPIIRSTEALTGTKAQAVAFGTEGPFLNALGMDTVIMGPGSIDQAHQPNEFVSHDQAKKGIEIIKSLVREYCC